MKFRVFILIVISLLTINIACADTTATSIQQPATPPITQPQNISFENCTKMFSINKEKLFYLTLGGITANKFAIEEIQTNNGYVIFSVANNKYLATVAGIDAENSILKITPCNDIYFFPPGVYIGIFKYIDMNLNIEIK